MKSRLPLIAYAIALLVVVIDQACKAWVSHSLQPDQTAPFFAFVDLTLIGNTGVSYGLFSGGTSVTRWLLSAFSAIVAVVLAVYVRKIERPFTAVGIGLIIGGAIGNLIDRVRLGAVVDFIDVRALHFPWIFNPADSAITIGVIVFLIELVIAPDKKPAGPNRDDHAV